MLYCTVLYCTVLYCTVLHCTVLYCTVLCYTVLYCTVLYCTALYCTVLYCTVLYCTVLYCTVLCFIVLYCTVLYCAVLCCAVLYCFFFFFFFFWFFNGQQNKAVEPTNRAVKKIDKNSSVSKVRQRQSIIHVSARIRSVISGTGTTDTLNSRSQQGKCNRCNEASSLWHCRMYPSFQPAERRGVYRTQKLVCPCLQ